MQQIIDEERNNPLDEALSLLCSWNLKHLCDKFKEQEVCTVAFQYLTDADISELIPKIGPRTIFRSHLLAWRQNHELRKQEPMVVLANTPVNATTAAIKNEIPEMNLVEEPEENSFESVSKEADLYEDSDSKTQSVITEPNQDNIVKESPAASKKKLGVRAVLNNSPEGKSAIAHYNNNKCLDMHYRKKVVRIVIGAALEKRMDMSINDFQAMNEQLLEIFPNESEDTFYVPRVGNTRARGMLYNKYINLSRNLRRNGLLEYKRQRTNTSR